MGKHTLQALTPERRAWVYDLVLAIAPVLVTLGVVADGQVQVWLMLAGALLGYGSNAIASRNVSPGPRDGYPNPEAMR